MHMTMMTGHLILGLGLWFCYFSNCVQNLKCVGPKYIEYSVLRLCRLVIKLFVMVWVTWAYGGVVA